MKKILLFCLLFIIPTGMYAGYEEEEQCFELLNNSISNDIRFNNSGTKDILKNGDLSKVLFSESEGSYINLSKYNKFKNNLVKNPEAHNFGGLTDKDFIARRNNIGTIIASNNYVITNIVGFGKDSNFDFPLDSKTTPFGDKYKLKGNFFKEYVLYTHHNYEGDFMSCGIVKINPLSGRTFTNISQNNYKTNILTGNNCSSGFEGNKVEKEGLEYYKLKSNICVVDYNDKDYLKMEVISIAYNNDSSYMNEYITHQLQVKAMDNMGNNAIGGLKGTAEKFMEYLDAKTCLKVIHGNNPSSLPIFCNGNFSSELAFSNGKSIFSYIFNSAYAKREGLSLEKEIEASKGMVVYDNIPYSIYKKLNSIEDETFKSYLFLSIIPNLEELIENRKNNNILLSPYEETFLKCGIDYKERSNILQDFVKNIKDVKNIDYSNLYYSNSKFGDCVIPYPDKTNLLKEIENSFSSNKLLAKKLNGTYENSKIPKEMQDYVQNIRKIEAEYTKTINEISKKFNTGEINKEEFIKLSNKEKKIFDIKIKELESKNSEINLKIKKEANKLSNAGLVEKDNEDKNNNIITVLLIILFLLIGLLILYFSLIKNKK